MTDPVETLARALAEEYFKGRFDDPEEAKTPYFWPGMNELHKEGWRHQARALLAQITPALVAESVAKEREACAKLADDAAKRHIAESEKQNAAGQPFLAAGEGIAACALQELASAICARKETP